MSTRIDGKSSLAKFRFRLLFLIFCLLPAILFVFLGQFSRLIVDDFCVVQNAIELGPWQSMRDAYESWTGAYSGMFFKGVLNQLDTEMPRAAPAPIVLLWVSGGYLLTRQILASYPIGKPDRAVTLAVAALCVGASINGFSTPQSFYWAAASMQYALPLAALAWYFATVLWLIRQDSTNLRWQIILLSSILISFLSAGAAELHAAFQATLFTLLMLLILILLRGSIRRRSTIVVGTGWLATLFGLLVQFMSPGVANRGSGYGLWIEDPLRDALLLVSRTNHHVALLISDSDLLASFFLLLALGLLVTLSCRGLSVKVDMPLRNLLNRGPLMLGLALQLIAVPLLWMHMSDHPRFFGRFSASFMVPVTLNLLFIAGFGFALWQRRRIIGMMKRRGTSVATFAVAVLALLTLLFLMTQIRSIHQRALTYLVLCIHGLLAVLAWQLAPALPKRDAMRWGSFLGAAYTLTLVTTYAIAAVGVSRHGEPILRTLTFAACLIPLLGVAWGVFLGFLLRAHVTAQPKSDTALHRLQIACAICVLFISIGITLGHARLIPQLQRYASEWDARHQFILEQRDSGVREVTVQPLSFNLAKYVRAAQIHMHDCPWRYYDVDKIVQAER